MELQDREERAHTVMYEDIDPERLSAFTEATQLAMTASVNKVGWEPCVFKQVQKLLNLGLHMNCLDICF